MEDTGTRHHVGAGLSVRLAAMVAVYVVILVCSLTIEPYTPWVVVIFASVSMLNRYVSYCVVWRVARDTDDGRARPSSAVTATVFANLFLSLAVIVSWLVRAAGESNGDIFSVGAACVTIATCCWVGRATCQLMFGIHRWTWAPEDLTYPWTSVHAGTEDDDEGDTETTADGAGPLVGYLLAQCNDAADEYYRQTTELIRSVQGARAKLGADVSERERVTAVHLVVTTASRRRDLAVEGERLATHLREHQPYAESAIDEPWNESGSDTLIAEAWNMATVEQGDEGPVLLWLRGRVDELLGTSHSGVGDTLLADATRTSDKINPQDKN